MKQAKLVALLLCGIVLVILPLLISNAFVLHLLILCLVYAVITSNWDLVVGYSGIFNFGHLAFFAVGAYSSAIVAISSGISPWWCLPIGGGIAVVASLVVALPSLRLRGLYFSLFTFAFQQIFYSLILINPGNLTGGSQGLMFIPALKLGSIVISRTNKFPSYYLALAFFLLSSIVLYRIVRSKAGLAFQALRDSEEYAISRGINPFKYKLGAVMTSAFFTGLIGAFYAHYMRIIGPAIIGWQIFILALAMLVLGGLGSLFGPMIASFGLLFVSEFLTSLGPYRFIILAFVMLFALLISPGDIVRKLQLATTAIRSKLRKPDDARMDGENSEATPRV